MMRNKLSKEIGTLMKQGAKEEAMAKKAQVQSMAEELAQLEEKEDQLAEEIKNYDGDSEFDRSICSDRKR